jgi:HK97 gp10 family phage protein
VSGEARIEVEGDEELARSLARAADEIGDPATALDKSGRLVEQRARTGAPYDSGALQRSIKATRSGVEVQVGPNVGVYAAVQEFGSTHTPAHPYLRPALDYSDTVVTGYFKDDADRALSRVKGA